MLIDRIKDDRLAAMKARDELKKNLLGTLFAAATKDGKAPDDAAVVKTIRSFLKSLEETMALLEARGLDAGAQRAEQAILEAYLPQAAGRGRAARQHRRDRGRLCRSGRPRPWVR